jgi:cell division septum initiation protein DivIVA
MAKKDIEEKIKEIEIFINNCKYQPLSSSKIIVPKDDLEQMLKEVMVRIPNEVERGKKIMRNRESILADARTKADNIITESVAEANRLVDQSQIVELANIRANEILEMARQQAQQIVYEAETQANDIRLGAMQYTKDKLSEVSSYLVATLQAERDNYESLISSLDENSKIVAANIAEVDNDIRAFSGMPEPAPAEVEQAAPEQDYNVYGKTEYSSDDEDDEYDDEYDDDDDFLDE